MRSMPLLLRIAIAGAAATAMVGIASVPAAAQTTSTVPFHADHTRTCMYMETEGELTFGVPAPQAPGVDVRGSLTERELPQAPPDPCQEIGNTFAVFEAYAGGQQVDDHTVWLPDPSSPEDQVVRHFAFGMANSSSFVPIDRVDVTVCRDFGPMLPAFSCGDTVRFGPPSVGLPPG